MDDDFCGLACPPLDFRFGSDGFGELGGYNFFDVVQDGGVSLENFFDNVEVDDDVGDRRIVSDDEVRVSDSILKNPNSDLGVKQQRSGKDMRLLIKNPETTVVHGKGKQLPPPHLMTGPDPENIVSGKGKQFRPPHLTGPEPIRHGKGKQFKILQEAHDPDYHSTSKVVLSTDHVIDPNPSFELSGPKVGSTKRTGMAKPEDSTKSTVMIDSSDSVNIKHSVTGIDYEHKLELSKRKLQESYGAAQQAKRQRRVVVLDFHPGSEKSRVQQRSCQGERFRTEKLQRLYNDCKSRPCLI